MAGCKGTWRGDDAGMRYGTALTWRRLWRAESGGGASLRGSGSIGFWGKSLGHLKPVSDCGERLTQTGKNG